VWQTEAVSLLDPQSLGTDTPRTLDGRSYPDRLREFERLDDQLLPLIRPRHAMTINALARAVSDPKVRSVLTRWLSSAEWRGLIERVDQDGPRAYVLGPRGRAVARASRHAA
jgi:hypothetical protein